MAMIKCPKCDKEISDKAVKCVHCGQVLTEKPKLFCSECGTEIKENDDICSKCPNLSENNICKSETVNIIDNKVIKYFELEEKIYEYESLIRYIKSHITKEIMDDICGNCEWYSISKCKKRMLVEI